MTSSAQNIGLTEHRDLRGGRPCWTADIDKIPASDPLPDGPVDITIVGAGVVGAMLADRLTRDGREVLLLDRRPPAHGSTAASTALVMWAADVPLTHLAKEIGEAEAARRWRRVYAAMRDLAAHIDATGIDCTRIDRPELYLAGSLLDDDALRAEGEMRRAHGLSSTLLDAASVAERFGIAPRAALLSEGCYEVDPVRLTQGLLRRARAQGARAHFPCDVVGLDGTTLMLDNGRTVAAKHVILAGGYERATLFLPPAFTVGSSYAIATAPGTAPLWGGDALIWEAASPYLYTRATADGRIIAGGEDEDFADADRRDALIGAKSGTIPAKLAAMIDVPDVAVDCAWSAAFGDSPDGLPAIGRAANHDKLWLASAFGGNGVSFAALAAEIIAGDLAGTPDPDAACFDPYRFG
ncbi:FAD-binding oxidoreductase [Sphingomonas panacisoli]|uniref:FAD-binding oxidoreductase n=1 Tax=Sphingomonas panacisoli TaxID=1813879 RepID=A0A5B8LG17_9SPHN|nr:FAD-dependent oxidoreductase [Sphingomonas panacisoli]QDZ07013.1 FAD-binding oxidoreductase [Sphingomonas panacisoli]